MSARVIDEPLAVAFAFSDGTSYTLNLHHLPCPALVRDLARGLAAMAHPHGAVDARNTAGQYRTAIGQMSQSLGEAGFTGGAGRLTRTQLIQFWLAHQPRAEQRTRLLLRSLDGQRQGLLLPEVSQYLAGPPLRRRPKSKPLTPYSPVEWDRLRLCCEKTIAEAMADQRAAIASAEVARDPQPDGWRTAANQMWLLLRHGPMTATEVAAYLGCSPKTVRNLGAPGDAARRLFPTMPAVIAFRLLLG